MISEELQVFVYIAVVIGCFLMWIWGFWRCVF